MLTAAQREFVGAQRRATLATLAPDGAPRLVPICFVLGHARDGSTVLYSPIDEKPKATNDPLALARVRDIEARPLVSLLFDHWAEDWASLGWVRVRGLAELLVPAAGSSASAEHTTAVETLRVKYPQYQAQAIHERPLIRIDITAVTSWGMATAT